MSVCALPPAVICAENIALLYLLHSVPVQPSRNEIGQSPICKGNYSLSFARERILVSTLAFLSSRNNLNHVTALCIEEHPELGSLNVVLAVNRTRWEDGNKVLQDLKQSLEKIFAILSEISEEQDRSRPVEYRVFSSIISMCSSRILSRLKFKAKKGGTPKQSLGLVLGEAISALKQADQQAVHSLPVALFTERANDVVRLADSWAKHQKLAELENLVEGVFRLKQIGGLQTLLDSIPNRAMCPSSRRSLVNIIGKVSRYREAARFLCRTALKIPSLRQSRVVLVNLPKEAFHRVSGGDHTPQFASTIARLSTNYQDSEVGYLCRLLKTSLAQLNDQLATQARKTLREAKIHADFQLVYHYELNTSRLPPRTICSSKDACFLCNAFILMHGKMHIPRYHGRLYPGWRLPLISNLHDLDLKLNLALENQIKNSLKTLLSRQEKTVYPDPNESTLLTLPLSTSTLRTSALVAATEREAGSANNSPANSPARPVEQSISLNDRALAYSSTDVEDISLVLGSRNTLTAEEKRLPEMGLSDQHATQVSLRCSLRTNRHNSTTSHVAELIQDVPRVSSIITTQEPQFHTAGSLELHIEYTLGTASGSNQNNAEIAYSIEWLSEEKARELLDHQTANIVDVELLQYQTLYELDCHEDMLIMARGAVVRITPRRHKTELEERGGRGRCMM